MDRSSNTSDTIYGNFFGRLISKSQFSKVDLGTNFDIFLKFEGFNPAGSIKLKTALALVADCENSGKLNQGAQLIESSSGNLGIALAMVCANRGYKFTCVVDPNASAVSLSIIRALGATVVIVKDKDSNGGYLGTRINYIKQQVSRNSSFIWLNQYKNPANPKGHECTTAIEIIAQYPNVDYIVVGAGTTGTLMGCSQYVRKIGHPAKIIAVDIIGSVTFGGKPGPRKIPGLGTSRKPEICETTIVDDVVWVSEIDTIRQCWWFAKKYGMLLGGSSGSVLVGIHSYKNKIPRNSTVVTISPDCGSKYVNTIYSNDWVNCHFPSALEEGALTSV